MDTKRPINTHGGGLDHTFQKTSQSPVENRHLNSQLRRKYFTVATNLSSAVRIRQWRWFFPLETPLCTTATAHLSRLSCRSISVQAVISVCLVVGCSRMTENSFLTVRKICSTVHLSGNHFFVTLCMHMYTYP